MLQSGDSFSLTMVERLLVPVLHSNPNPTTDEKHVNVVEPQEIGNSNLNAEKLLVLVLDSNLNPTADEKHDNVVKPQETWNFLSTLASYYGEGTNMVTECCALLDGLKMCTGMNILNVDVETDSEAYKNGKRHCTTILDDGLRYL
ncbi:hypothetical protein ACH5RR_000981 [Cinchona calisaya]|uniref:RNase H type-1 domain-containing protein n=1 Tax=Cinchona calisaya TaxID=153742 RepID=A0ABD3B252_9GENT